ncbi:MAG TPA: hypothetical protein PK141_17715 [Polyangiaceae bacterium]|nr:hypothetical protein [Polyangiaceae bacterium]
MAKKAPRTRASKSPAKSSAAAATKASPAEDAETVRGELRQLAEIRAHFPQLPDALATSMLAHHDADACREKGKSTRAVDIFRAAMSWARIFGAHASDPAVSPVRVRWFLDCLTTLGSQLSGKVAVANPSEESSYDDVAQKADKLLARTKRRAKDAAGTHTTWRAALDKALEPDGVHDPRISSLRQLAKLLRAWSSTASASPPLAAYDLTDDTASSLAAAAEALDAATARRPAPQQIQRDSPAINESEGRLLYVMRPLWDDLAEAREDGRSSLQLTVSPALLRGLDVNARKPKAAAAPTA